MNDLEKLNVDLHVILESLKSNQLRLSVSRGELVFTTAEGCEKARGENFALLVQNALVSPVT